MLCKLDIHTQMDEIRPVLITLWKNELQLDQRPQCESCSQEKNTQEVPDKMQT